MGVIVFIGVYAFFMGLFFWICLRPLFKMYCLIGTSKKTGKRGVFFKSYSYDDAMIVGHFGWRSPLYDDIVLEYKYTWPGRWAAPREP